MATAYHIQVPASNTGLLKFDQQDATAAKVSEILQQDLQSHHVFVNHDGFHNHLPHLILALFGTGAGADVIQAGYLENADNQRPVEETHSSVADELHDWDKVQKYLANEKHYPDFLVFFQREIEKHGYEHVLNEYLFKGDERADDMFQRMFAGFLHPIIQLMYGVEWEQPAIVAEALAQASVHSNRLKGFFDGSEKAAQSATTPMPPILDLIDAITRDEKLSKAAEMKDSNKVFDGILVRAPDEMIRHASRVKVTPEELDERTAEMFHTAVYAALGAAIHPPKEPKVDFFLMHHVNAAPIFVTFNSRPWISTANKIRMLEYKIRLDLVQYAARGCPELRYDGIVSYRPIDKALVSKPAELLPRFHAIPDDGHTIKLVRSIAISEELSKKYEDKPWAKIRGDDVWLKLNYIVLDGSENVGRGQSPTHGVLRWVRSAGFEEAWKDVPDRD